MFLAKLINKKDCSPYRDDGLLILRNVNGQQIDRRPKNFIKIFKDIGFASDVETNLKILNFLDITFDLKNGIYRSYKPNLNQTIYYYILTNLQTIHHKFSPNCQK